MNKWGIIGACCFALAVVCGYFFKFSSSLIIEVALSAFGFTCVVIGAFKDAGAKNISVWKTIIVLIVATAGGVICAIGGVTENLFVELSGAVIAVLSIIFGIVTKNKAE